MPSDLDKLEQRIRELIGLADSLRRENESFRRAAAGTDQQVSSSQALAEIDRLKSEKRKLENKLQAVDLRLEELIQEIDQLAGKSA
jgi:predicted RNase H-like nuclease (RuvC/YqgF family)